MERWRIRNSILSILAKNRAGNYMYQLMQKHFGQFNDPDFIRNKIDEINEIIVFALNNGVIVTDTAVLELGTGWVPLAPVMFSLYGAKSVTSIDINRYYIPSLLKKTAVTIIDKIENEGINNSFFSAVDHNKIALLKKYSHKPGPLMEALNIKLLSPIDARCTHFPNNAFNLYYSIDTLEHIQPDDIYKILKESYRIVNEQGHFLHSIDLTDHFSYFDDSITSINFLKFDNIEWNSLCNRYTYHNRLRKSNYEQIIENSGFKITKKKETENTRARNELNQGFHINKKFKKMNANMLCIDNLCFISKKIYL
ncbi:MAG TPA: class I SAM-dependent methyltransferase [Spirochaetota bacterium]|nr:class I SAM-dependent methyltransferase [Spirochaetota bacterium]